jgi:hypothetical protein
VGRRSRAGPDSDLRFPSARYPRFGESQSGTEIHRYDDHLFLVLHAPQPGIGGHVHYVELDQFIGNRYW